MCASPWPSHAGLRAHGVTDYSLERLWEDYRLSVIGHWWSHLHRVIAAFEDLDCAALL